MEIIKENAIHVLNTSLALGYPFTNNISVGDDHSWYKGYMIDYSGAREKRKLILENY
jgi:hypothetical protein